MENTRNKGGKRSYKKRSTPKDSSRKSTPRKGSRKNERGSSKKKCRVSGLNLSPVGMGSGMNLPQLKFLNKPLTVGRANYNQFVNMDIPQFDSDYENRQIGNLFSPKVGMSESDIALAEPELFDYLSDYNPDILKTDTPCLTGKYGAPSYSATSFGSLGLPYGINLSQMGKMTGGGKGGGKSSKGGFGPNPYMDYSMLVPSLNMQNPYAGQLLLNPAIEDPRRKNQQGTLENFAYNVDPSYRFHSDWQSTSEPLILRNNSSDPIGNLAGFEGTNPMYPPPPSLAVITEREIPQNFMDAKISLPGEQYEFIQ